MNVLVFVFLVHGVMFGTYNNYAKNPEVLSCKSCKPVDQVQTIQF